MEKNNISLDENCVLPKACFTVALKKQTFR